MSKSYRKPYAAITGLRSAKHDKLVARRCWRRAQEQALRECTEWEELVIPKRLEASFNDVWSWGRDGKQTLQSPPHESLQYSDSEFDRWWFDYRTRWYRKCHSK
jgi:hypothetical protein